MATGWSFPRPVFQEPLGCCLAASHLMAPLMSCSVRSSTTTSSLSLGGSCAGAAKRRGVPMAAAREERMKWRRVGMMTLGGMGKLVCPCRLSHGRGARATLLVFGLGEVSEILFDGGAVFAGG